MRYAIGSLLRNLGAGARLASFRPIDLLAFRIELPQLLLLFLLSALIDVAGDWLRAAEPREFSSLGAGPELYSAALLLLGSAVIALINRQRHVALALPVVAMASLTLVQVVHYVPYVVPPGTIPVELQMLVEYVIVSWIVVVLVASAGAFATLKLAGAVWLAWVGARMLLARRPPSAPPRGASAPGAAAILREAVLVAALNPKVALFFLAFVPQFIDPASPSPALAFVLLGMLFVVSGTLVTGVLGTMAAAAAASLRAGPADRGWRRVAAPLASLLPRAVGAVLLGLGLRLTLAER